MQLQINGTFFAFTFNGRQLQYTRFPQGYAKSPSIFNHLLAAQLAQLDMASTVLQYVDEILICSWNSA